MKIRWYDRILLFIIALFLLAAALLFFAVLSAPVQADVAYRIANLGTDEIGRMLLIGGGAILLVLGVYLLCSALIRKRRPVQPKSVLVRHSENGSVEISLAAMDTLVQKSARSFQAVRDCISSVSVTPMNEVAILVRLSLMPDTDVPDLSNKLQAEVKDYVQSHSGVTVREVRVLVESTGINPAARVQ